MFAYARQAGVSGKSLTVTIINSPFSDALHIVDSEPYPSSRASSELTNSHPSFRTRCTTLYCHDVISNMTQILVRCSASNRRFWLWCISQPAVAFAVETSMYATYKLVNSVLLFTMIDILHYVPRKCVGLH